MWWLTRRTLRPDQSSLRISVPWATCSPLRSKRPWTWGIFAAGNNFDYRLVYLLLTLPQLWTGPVDPMKSTIVRNVPMTLVIGRWRCGLLLSPVRAVGVGRRVGELGACRAAGRVTAAAVPPLSELRHLATASDLQQGADR